MTYKQPIKSLPGRYLYWCRLTPEDRTIEGRVYNPLSRSGRRGWQTSLYEFQFRDAAYMNQLTHMRAQGIRPCARLIAAELEPLDVPYWLSVEG